MNATDSYTPTPETLFAYTILVERARQRRETTYRELYDLMQKEFGWPAFQSGHSWFQRLPLAEVGTLCGSGVNRACRAWSGARTR